MKRKFFDKNAGTIGSGWRMAIAAFVTVGVVLSQAPAEEKPKPDIADATYGVFERNVFDLWKAPSTLPAPLVIYIHGGGFNSGSKEKLSEKLLGELLKNGVSVMAINYRLLPDAAYPDPLTDCIRALQFARVHASEWNIDPNRIALTGSSAGALASLWIAFHDDMAVPKSVDPVLRQSTRVRCVAMYSGQTVLEPSVVRSLIGDVVLGHSFFKGTMFGLKKEELGTAKGDSLFKQASPVTYLTADDPPVWAYYSVPFASPGTVSDAIHHPNFGAYLKKRMNELGLECVTLHKDSSANVTASCVEFLCRHLK